MKPRFLHAEIDYMKNEQGRTETLEFIQDVTEKIKNNCNQLSMEIVTENS